MDSEINSLSISTKETTHYKPEFEDLAKGKKSITLQELSQFLTRLKLSDYDIKKISKILNSNSITFPYFVAAMRLTSLTKQNKKYSNKDILKEQIILARKSRIIEKPSSSQPVSRPVPKHPVRITVTDPELVQSGWFGSSSYYLYKISSVIESQDFEVNRRFSDLDWLHRTLRGQYTGLMIPDLPEKTYLKTNDPEFIEQRRQNMEEYLNTVRVHQVLGTCFEFLGFLRTPNSEFQKFKESEQVNSDWLEVKSLKDTISQTLASIETRFQNSEEEVSQEYLGIKGEVEAKKEAFNEMFFWLSEYKSNVEKSKHIFSEVLHSQIDFNISASKHWKNEGLNSYFESINSEKVKINTLFNTLGSFQEIVDKKNTAKNLVKRGSQNSSEIVSNFESKCQKVFENIKTEHESFVRSYSSLFPALLDSFIKSQETYSRGLCSYLSSINT